MDHRKDSVTSADGTTIGYRFCGEGPGLIIVHGGLQSSQNYTRLAAALSTSFTVYVFDRRGRGLSGDYGAHYGIDKDCADVASLQEHTDARLLFGHSSGGLIALQAALTVPGFEKLALYDPALSIDGSIPFGWVPAYERALAAGRMAEAFVIVNEGLSGRIATKPPSLFAVSGAKLTLRASRAMARSDTVTLEALIPTVIRDVQIIRAMDRALGTFTALAQPTLLLGGADSPAYLHQALEALADTIPNATLRLLPGLEHLAPVLTAPEQVAVELERFFQTSA